MATDASAQIRRIKILKTAPHACSYLEGEQSTTAFVDPELVIEASLYTRLAEIGFRRSGPYLYTPMCGTCSACIPTRVVVHQFTQNRAQKRCMKQNDDIDVQQRQAIDTAEHYPLYENYINERHKDGDMYPPSRDQFEQFLGATWECTQYFEFRIAGKLIGCAVVDVLPDSLSAIYTYFDPLLNKRGLGNFAILYQISLAAKLNKLYVYLGYWIENCQKMSYKKKYQPMEFFKENSWELSE